jgi:alpha/beta hydrolase family protein
VLIAPLLPFLLKTNDNPDGIDRSVLDEIMARIAADRPAAMKDFMDRSYNIDLLGGGRVSDQAWQNSFYIAISASAHAALRCVTACLEDFRGDLAAISVPVLVIHGDQDRVLPYEATSWRLPALLKNARFTTIAGGPHAIIWTHADEVNRALLDFIGHPRAEPRSPGGDSPVDNHAGLGQVHPSAGLDHGDLDNGLAERDEAKHVDRDPADPKRTLDSLVDHVGKKGSRWSAVLSRTVPRALSRPGRLISRVPAGQAIGHGFCVHRRSPAGG